MTLNRTQQTDAVRARYDRKEITEAEALAELREVRVGLDITELGLTVLLKHPDGLIPYNS